MKCLFDSNLSSQLNNNFYFTIFNSNCSQGSILSEHLSHDKTEGSHLARVCALAHAHAHTHTVAEYEDPDQQLHTGQVAIENVSNIDEHR